MRKIGKVGMIGLGKLGLPCILAMEKHGKFEIFGYDKSSFVKKQIQDRSVDYWEEHVNEYLQSSNLVLVESIFDLVEKCDLIFVAVQTPHDKAFEGVSPLPNNRKDFDYSFLTQVASEIAIGLKETKNNPLISIISTVLPGTMHNKILPILTDTNPDLRFAYNPYFIAMGTTIFDFLNPEFLLIGGLNPQDCEDLEEFYKFIDAPCMKMKIQSAELTKVAYNTFIGFKIIFANTLAEIVDKRGGNVDEVTDALSQATARIMSGRYLSAGMGDGGGCHPRDQIAMSWLAQECNLSFDLFEMIAKARDSQTQHQASILKDLQIKYTLPVIVLGKAYKANSPLTIGSPALLLEYFLSELAVNFSIFDPWVDVYDNRLFSKPAIYFVATKHEKFLLLDLPAESVLVDPWGFVDTHRLTLKELVLPGRGNVW